MTKQVDALEFQKRFKSLLEKKLKQAKKHINEEDSSKYFVDDKEEQDTEENSSYQTENPDPNKKDEEEEGEENDESDIDSHETPEEHEVILEIESKALEFGADVVAYQYGVMQIEFNEKEESEKFVPFIEEYDKIESFEFVAHADDYSEVEEDAEDIAFYTYWIYLKPEVVSFDYYDELYPSDDDEESDIEDEDENSEDGTESDVEENPETEVTDEEDETKLKQESYISEVTRRIRVNYKGIKKIKMTCGPGYKYNHKTMACEKIQGKQLADMRAGLRKALASKRQGGAALKNRTAARARRAQHYRKAFGL